MPRTVQYGDGAVIYFMGEDSAEKIYLLQSGKVILSYQDIETGMDLIDSVQPGEFFGVKSALGRYPQEENAIVSREATIRSFSIPEFEQMASSNVRIIMQMLTVFSRQLRRVHRQTANIMANQGYEEENPEQGLFNVGEHYLKNKRYSQAQYIFSRYLTYYPSGKNAASAERNIQLMQTGEVPEETPQPPAALGTAPADDGDGSAAAKAYYNAVSLISQEKFQQAFGALKKILEANPGPEYSAKCSYEIGRCLFILKKYDQCVQHFTAMLSRYPKHPNMPDALFLIAQSHENRGKKELAGIFYKKILSMVPNEDDPASMKAKKALAALGGA